VTIEIISANDDQYDFWFPTSVGVTTIGAACHCIGTCSSVLAQFTFTDRSNNTITNAPNPLTCSTGTSLSSWSTFSGGNQILTGGEGIRFTVNSDPTTQDTVILCVNY